jgi:hypothetical protein
MFRVPKFAPDDLRFLAVCVHLDLGPKQKSLGPDSVLFSRVRRSSNGDVFARRILDTDEEGKVCHFHVEAGLETWSFSLFSLKTEDDPADDVLSAPRGLVNKTVDATIWARFRVKKPDLPEAGVINALSGVSFSTGGYELVLSGSTVEVRNRECPVRELRWWPTGKTEFGIEISGYMDELKIDDDLFESALAVLRKGFDELVLGKKTKKSKRHARIKDN